MVFNKVNQDFKKERKVKARKGRKAAGLRQVSAQRKQERMFIIQSVDYRTPQRMSCAARHRRARITVQQQGLSAMRGVTWVVT